MKKVSHKKVQKVRKGQNGPPYLSVKKKKFRGSERREMEYSTIFSENILNLTRCTIIKMPVFRVKNFSAGRTKYTSTIKI